MRKSPYGGWLLMIGMTLAWWGLMTFMTQIETLYFLHAFPKLTNIELIKFFIRGLVYAVLFVPAGTWIAGGFAKGRPRLESAVDYFRPIATPRVFLLIPVNVALYLLFGYFVAWQFGQLRVFYSGSSDLLSFWGRMHYIITTDTLLVPFRFLRTFLWTLFGLPVIIAFRDRLKAGIPAVFLAFALLPTTQFLYPNVLIPFIVRMAHIIEVSISTGIFGVVCLLLLGVPNRKTVDAGFRTARSAAL
jgi:hypothetical protein